MSPDLIFWYELALKMALTATIVVIVSVTVERSGPFIGALIAALPTGAGAAYRRRLHHSRLRAPAGLHRGERGRQRRGGRYRFDIRAGLYGAGAAPRSRSQPRHRDGDLVRRRGRLALV